MAASANAAAQNVDVLIDGHEIPDSDFTSYTVERDMNQPDMAVIVLSNHGDVHTSSSKLGASVEIKVGKDGVSIFKGEIVGVEPVYRGGETKKLTIRALNKMQRLLRKKKSKTFTNKTDQQIINEVCGDVGLTLDWKHEKTITYKHVYQHNLTDLEFIRMRAARMGCYVWCVDTKLFVQQPDLSKTSGIKLSLDQGGDVRGFTPRMSSAKVVKKVTVKGWNPETKELISGDASVSGSKLGSQTSVAGSGDLGNEETFTVDQPIWSAEEATVLAGAILRDSNLSFITGECEVTGNPKLELGSVVEIEANALDAQDPFNGKYYVMGLCHRHAMSKSKDGGFVSIIKFARDAQKK